MNPFLLIGVPAGLTGLWWMLRSPSKKAVATRSEVLKGNQYALGKVGQVVSTSSGKPAAVSPVAAPAIQQSAAATMNAALQSHGYKKSDMPIYKVFQASAGLAQDGFPGPKTMGALGQALQAAGIPMAAVTIYAFTAKDGFDGTNAPTYQEWLGQPGWSGPPPLVSAG